MASFDARTSDLESAALHGMTLAWHADRQPDASAITTQFEEYTWAELNARTNQLARLFEAYGIGPGDAVAMVLKNRSAFVETYHAAMRSGVRVTPANFHLNGEQAGYIVDNCEAKALIYDGALTAGAETLSNAPNVRLALAVGGSVDGFEDYETAIAEASGADPQAPVLGSSLL